MVIFLTIGCIFFKCKFESYFKNGSQIIFFYEERYDIQVFVETLFLSAFDYKIKFLKIGLFIFLRLVKFFGKTKF